MFKFLLVTLVAVTIIIPQCDADCIWYGVCWPTEEPEDGEKIYNCPYDGPGHKLDDKEAQGIMQRLCPELCKQKTKMIWVFSYKIPICIRPIRFYVLIFSN